MARLVSPGFTALMNVSVVAPGATCATGGQQFQFGLDNGDGGETAYDGVLGAGEVDSTQVVCNGEVGPQGDPATDDQTLTLVGNTLSIDNGNSVDLSSYLDNTDDQNLTGATLSGTTLQVDIEDGTSASVDLAALQDGTGTDDQTPQLRWHKRYLSKMETVSILPVCWIGLT